MKNNILFFTFLTFAMINYMQAQDEIFKLDISGNSEIYDITNNIDSNQWEGVSNQEGHPLVSPYHIGDDYKSHDWNKSAPDGTAGNYELDENSNAYVYAGFYGYVLSVTTTEDDNYSYGNRVILRSLDNNKFALLYAHLSEINVQKGDIVHPGDKIGKVGISGLPTDQCNHPNYICSHLHLALWKNIDNPTALANMENGHPPSGPTLVTSLQYSAPFWVSVPVDNYQIPTNTVNVTSPANNIEDIDPLNAELDWDVFTGADKYYVQVSTKPDVNPNTGGLLYPEVANTYSNLYSAHRPLLQGYTRYYWTVKPIKNSGAYIGEFSTIHSFTTGVDSRPNIFPSNLAIYDENNTNQITSADIGNHIYVRVDQNVTPLDHQDLGSYVEIYLSKVPYITSTHSIRLSRIHMNIDSNESSKTSQVRVRIPGYAFDDSNYIIAVVDSQNIHQESNEDDNIQVIPITLNKVHPFIVNQSTGSVAVEFNAPHNENLVVVMSNGDKFTRRGKGWMKKIHATRCYYDPISGIRILKFGNEGMLTVSLYGDQAEYGTRVVPLIPIDNDCNEITTTQSARQSTNTKTSLDVPASEIMEVQVVNLFNPTKPIKKTVDKSTFDIKSLNLPSGFYVIRYADGTSKKVYLQ